jgi:phosphoribosylanthranilate isomerase
MTLIKFCGMRREQDVAAAVELGVGALGFVFWPDSPRFVDYGDAERIIRLLPDTVVPVGVFVAPTDDELDRAVQATGIRVAQIHASTHFPVSAACEVWPATSLEHPAPLPPAGLLVLDAHDPQRHGGTGRTIDWDRAAQIARTRRLILAGGLTPANIAAAIRCVRPYGVDVASGIEDSPGVKNVNAMRDFVAAVHQSHHD